MAAPLPEDIVNDLKRDFAHGFEDFREGAAMPIGGLVLVKELRNKKFIVECFSEKYYIQNTTRTEARERIDTAKEELAHLLSLFPALRDEVGSLDVAFYFCYNDGKSAVCIAKEEDSQFVYHGE